MFQLLIFLLISTTFRVRPALKIDLPHARTAGPARTERLTVTVGPQGAFYIAGVWVAQDDLQPRLRKLRSAGGDRPLVIETDRRATSGALVFALDAARGAGYKHIVLPTTPEKERTQDAGIGESRESPGAHGPAPD